MNKCNHLYEPFTETKFGFTVVGEKCAYCGNVTNLDAKRFSTNCRKNECCMNGHSVEGISGSQYCSVCLRRLEMI